MNRHAAPSPPSTVIVYLRRSVWSIHAPEPDQAKGTAHGGDGEYHAEIAVGEAKLCPDVRVEDRDNVGLSETGKKREEKAEGKEPEVPNDECKIVQIGLCAPQKFDFAA